MDNELHVKSLKYSSDVKKKLCKIFVSNIVLSMKKMIDFNIKISNPRIRMKNN